jgi:C4-dicarboxylate-specific signal transduction histidine kinase
VNSAQHLTRWYWLALGAVALLSIGGSLVVGRLVAGQRGAAEIIDVAGRQRMLSQRIGMTLRERERPSADRAAIDDELKALVTRLVAAQEWLETPVGQRGGDMSSSSPEARSALAAVRAGADGVRATLAQFVEAVQRAQQGDAAAAELAVTLARGSMLDAFERQVQAFSDVERAEVDRAMVAEHTLLGLVLLLLLVEAMFVFRPLARSLRLTLARLESALETVTGQQQRLRRLVDAAGDGSAVLDGEGRCLEVSERVQGWFPALGHGGDFFEAVLTEDQARAARQTLAQGLTPSPAHLERGDNAWELRYLLERRDPVQWLAVVRDVSAARALYTTVRQRDEAEARARLTTTERLASLGTLAAGIAHEINNPAAWIRANTDFVIEQLSADTPRANQAELLDTLAQTREGADRICRIVDDMRSMSRGAPDLPQPIDPQRALERILRLAQSELTSRALVEVAHQPMPTVLATDVELGQVFLNLLVNAVQALPPEQAREASAIAVRSATDARGWAVIEIEDNGCGISRDVAKHVFTPFFTTKPPGVGRGLGLSICHTIVTGLGGTLDFRSAQRLGTIFRVTLPPTNHQHPRT